MKLKITGIIFSCLLAGSCKQKDIQSLIIPGIENPEILLNGQWEVNLEPESFSVTDTVSGHHWKKIQVPGEAMMQGFPIKHDKPFAYRKMISVPDDYKGKRINLRFEGVYSYCRVWVNGDFVADHSGGFTSWECDVTSYIKVGTDNWLYVEVTDNLIPSGELI